MLTDSVIPDQQFVQRLNTLATPSTKNFSSLATGDTNDRFRIDADGTHYWGPGNAAFDTKLRRNGTGVLQQSAGTQAQVWQLYNTTDSDSAPTNYERVEVSWTVVANTAYIRTIAGGTGTGRNLVLRTEGAGSTLTLGAAGNNLWGIATSNNWVALIDNTYDIGASGATRPRSIYWGTQALAPSGSAAAPSYAFTASTLGFYYNSTNATISLAGGAADLMQFNSTGLFSDTTYGIIMKAAGILGWTSGTSTGAAVDTQLVRDAAGTIGQRNGVNAQIFRVYNTFTSSTSYEAMELNWVANPNVAMLMTTKGSVGGSIRALGFGVGSTVYWNVNTSGHFIAATDNSNDIGASGATRPRSIYWGTQALAPNGSAATPSYSFATATGLGFYQTDSADIAFTASTAQADILFGGGASGLPGVNLASASAFSWGSGAANLSRDTVLVRDAAGVVAQKNGTNAQTFRVYGTTTGPHYLIVSHTGTAGQIYTNTTDSLAFGVGGAIYWGITTTGPGHWFAVTDNSNDIGLPANRPRSIYWGTQSLGPNGAAATPAYSFANFTGLGFYATAATTLALAQSGALAYVWNGDQFQNRSDTGSLSFGVATDTIIIRDAANVIAQKNSTNGQTFRIYGTTTGPKYLLLQHNGTNVFIDTVGTGTLFIGGNATAIQPDGDNIVTMGSASERWVAFYAAAGYNVIHALSDANPTAQVGDGQLALGAGGGTALDVLLVRDGAGILAQKNGNNAQIHRTYGGNGHNMGLVTVNESLTIAAAATTVGATSIPAGAILLSVAVRVTTAIPTAATFTVTTTVGGTVLDTAAVSTAVNSTDPGTAAGASYRAAATTVTITPNLTPAAATGVVRLCYTYLLATPPTS